MVNNSKGYGFISRDNGENVLVHFCDIPGLLSRLEHACDRVSKSEID